MFTNTNVLTPKTYEELTHQAKRILASKRLLPREKQNSTVAEIEAIIQIGQAYNLTPWQSVQAIMIVNGQASVWGDFLIGLVWASGKAKEISESSKGSIQEGTYVATCIAKRDNSVISRSFSVDDAKKAGLWGKGPIWKGYPARMLQMRARSWALRDGFSDVTKGLVAVEEALDYKPLDDETKPNEVEQEIIKNIATKTEDQPENIEPDEATPEDLLQLVLDRCAEENYEISKEVADKEILSFLNSKKGKMSDLVDRATNNFEVFYGLIIKHFDKVLNG